MANQGKKRSATTKINGKPSKNLKKQEIVEEEQIDQDQVEEGLFDNLDEEMDPTELDNIMEHLNESEEEEDDELEEVEVEEDEGEAVASEEEEEEEEQVVQSTEEKSTVKKFRDLYMTKVTQAFGSDLDTIRQEPNLSGPRLNILIDSLEAGIDIFSTLEQEIILADQ